MGVDRYVVGLEKTLFCGMWSVEVRMPFTEAIDIREDEFTIEAGNIGNLAVNFKRLLYKSHCTAISAGVGVSTPTAEEARLDPPVVLIGTDMSLW